MTLLETKAKIRDEFLGENGIHGVGIGDNVIHLYYEEIKSGPERDHVATIRNLMALASRPGTAAEGINARQQAERLAEKHGIDLATLQPDPAPIPQPSPGAAAQPAPKPVSDQYMTVLRKFGWRIERRPQSLMFVSDRPGMYDHQIEITPDGWTHYISGMIRFAGQTPKDLQQHMHLHVT